MIMVKFEQVARCTKIISPNTEDAKYVINVKQIAKVLEIQACLSFSCFIFLLPSIGGHCHFYYIVVWYKVMIFFFLILMLWEMVFTLAETILVCDISNMEYLL